MFNLKLPCTKIIFSVLAILFFGLLTLYSSSSNSIFFKQLIFSVIASVVAFVLYKSFELEFYKELHWPIYFGNILLLIFVKFAGTTVLGSQRWIQLGPVSIQPSEIAKVCLIIFLASWLSRRKIENYFDVFQALTLAAIPSFLVLVQPDLGTTLVYITISFAMVYWAGAKFIQLVLIVSPFLAALFSSFGYVLFEYQDALIHFKLTVPAVVYLALIFFGTMFAYKSWRSPWLAAGIMILMGSNILAMIFRSFFWGLLKEYQQKRLTIFLDPYSDPLGAGYHIIQSLYAIGSGGVLGQGIKQGSLTQGNFVPEQHTDFIFSAIGEELGLIGAATVLLLFTALCFFIIRYAKEFKDKFSSLMAVGIFAMLFFHVVVNIGMNLGVMPITGVPLPFISYGGSSLLVNFFLVSLMLKAVSFNNKSSLYRN